jgi:dTDP-4-amino-4,6-dideoxygalactose transaminase
VARLVPSASGNRRGGNQAGRAAWRAPAHPPSPSGGDFPVAERLSDSELSLPMYPELTQTQLDTVVSAVKAARPLEAATR